MSYIIDQRFGNAPVSTQHAVKILSVPDTEPLLGCSVQCSLDALFQAIYNLVQLVTKSLSIACGRIFCQTLKGFLHLEAPGPDVRLQCLRQKLHLWIATLLEQFLQTKAEYLQGVHQCLHLLRGGTG